MKRIAFLPVFLCLLAASWQAAGAEPDFASFPLIQTNHYVVPADAVVPDEQWVIAQNVIVEGETRDDLFALAGDGKSWFALTNSGLILVTGSVGGDLWAAGQKIEIQGPVEHDLRSVSQALRVDSRLGGNLWALATTMVLDSNAIVVGSARIGGDYVYLRGTVDGNVVIKARKVVIDGIVNGSVSVEAAEVSILSNTRIQGALVGLTPGSLTPDPDAVITGGISRRPPAPARNAILFDVMSTLLYMVGAILTGIFFLLFAPRLVVRSTLCMETYPWRALLIGLAVLLLTPFIAFFMFVSWLGMPLSLVITALWGASAYLGRFVAALSVARLLTGKRRTQPIATPSPRLMLLGIVVFYATSFLPDFLSHAIWLWFTVTGLGGLIMACRGALLPIVTIPPPLPRPDSSVPPP